MSTAKIVVLFIIGLFLVFLTLPIASLVSAALSYIIGIIVLAIGILLAIKRGGRTLPLVLGIVLTILAVIAIGATALIHIAVYILSKSVETKYVTGMLGQPIATGNWEITVLNVRESRHIRRGDTYFTTKEGQKAVVVTIRIRNVGREISSVSDIWSFTLVTNLNKSYGDVTVYHFDLLWNVGEEVKTGALWVRELERLQSLAPGTYVEGDILFDISQNEKPLKLFFKVGVIGPTQVEVALSK